MHRNERFAADYLFRIQNLLQVLCPYIIQKYKEMPVETQELNSSLANFLKVRNLYSSKNNFVCNRFDIIAYEV